MKTELDIEACKQGDKNALGTLYRVYSNKLMGICRHYIHDENMVKDVLHDAFIIIFTSIKSLKDNSKLEGSYCAEPRVEMPARYRKNRNTIIMFRH